MNCWLHRISHFAQISNPLLEAGFLSIGFRAFSSDRFIDTAIAGKVELAANDVEKSLKAFGAGKPVNMRAALIDNATAEWKARIHEGLDCEKFTKLVEWYLKKIGADFACIPATCIPAAEQSCDADVVARFDNTKTYVNVLVKFYDGTTPLWELNEIMDFAQTQADADEYHVVPWIITSADSCSNGARLVAKENNVRLICMDEFVRMLIGAGFEGSLY